MTLRNNISLRFVLLTTLSLGLVLYLTYVLFARYTAREFALRLQDRAHIAAQVILEEDELGARVLDDIRKQHLRSLPEEEEYVFRLDTISYFQAANLPVYIKETDLLSIIETGYVEIKRGHSYGVGIRYDDNEGTFASIVFATDFYGLQKLRKLRGLMMAGMGLYLLFLFFLSRWYSKQVLTPIAAIIQQMRAINSSNLHLRLPEDPNRNDELNSLAQTFNQMLDRLETSIEAQTNFISNASHQLKNPLTAILGEIETSLAHPRDSEQYRESLLTIEEESNRLKRLILRLLHLAQTGGADEENNFNDLRIDELVFELAEEFLETDKHNVRIDFRDFPADPEQLSVYGHRALLRIALHNVLENGFKFSQGRDVSLALRIQEPYVVVIICDKGVGIPEEAMPHIFDPFFRARNANELPGFGIGLPMVRKIIQLHEGELEVSSFENEGTCVKLFLPRSK